MPLPSQSLRKQGSSVFRALLQFDEQQSDSSPNQLTHTHDQCHEDAGTGSEAQTGSGHKKTTLATAQLQRDEEKQIGKERGESQDEHTIDEVDVGHEDQQNEEDLQSRTDAARELQEHGTDEVARLLLVQGCDLPVDGVECSPPLDHGQMTQEVHHSVGQALLVSYHKEPDTENAEADDGQHKHRIEYGEGMDKKKDDGREQPKPEVAEDMGHGIEDHRRRSTLCANLRCQLHDTVRLTAHQSARRGIVECKARHRDLVEPQKGDALHRLAVGRRLAAYPLDDQIPRGSVEHIEKHPQRYDGEKPVARMFQSRPHLRKVKLGDHDDQYDESKNEEAVLVFLFHAVERCCMLYVGYCSLPLLS